MINTITSFLTSIQMCARHSATGEWELLKIAAKLLPEPKVTSAFYVNVFTQKMSYSLYDCT